MSMRDQKTTLSNQYKDVIAHSLPLIPENALNLKNIPTAGLMHPSVKEDRLKTGQWAIGIRQRIQICVNQKENVPKELLLLLKNELIEVIIKALQENSSQNWTFLHAVLQLVLPFNEYLAVQDWDQELQHYLKRIWTQLISVRGKQIGVDIWRMLKQVFPKVTLYVEKESDSTFQKPCPKSSITPRLQASNMIPKPLICKNNMDLFSTKITPDERMSLFPKPMTILDVHRSIGSVAYDIAAYESFWGSCHGLTAQAVNINLPAEILEQKPKASEEKPVEDLPMPIKKSKSFKKTEALLVLSGREAVEYYIKCQYPQKVEHLYFNLAPSCHYRPYHLVSVHKDKVNAEYYLFSSFGVLHVDSNLYSETFRLTEWQRHAVLWEAVHEIPFFKNYLISKMFYRWKAAKRYLQLLKIKDTLEKSLLQSMPIYEAGLLQVSKLLNELVTIDFLPFQSDKTYTLPKFEEAVFQVQQNAKEYLERFFRLCKVIVDVIMFESFKKLRFCEEQMTAKNMFSRDSVYLMKMKNKQRTANFLKAKNETSHLGNFVLLIDQMTVEYLFTIAKSHIHKFIHDVLSRKCKKNGFFSIKLIFNEEEQLEFSPPIEECQEFLDGTIHGLAFVLCSKAVPLGVLEMTKKKSDASHPDISDSSEPMKRYMKQFMSGNPHLIRNTPDIAKYLPFVSQSQDILEDNLSEQVNLDKLQKTMPTKCEDDWGVATPDNIQREHAQRLQISGEGFLGQYTPLFTSKLEEKLLADPQYINSIELQDYILSSAKKDLERYINSLKWLEPIYKACKEWTTESLSTFDNLPPPDVEQKLNELNVWSKKVKEVENSYITKKHLFWVDCSDIHNYLIPRLDFIYQQLLEYVLNASKNNSILFCKQINIMAKILEKKPEDVISFAEYVQIFKKSKEQIPEHKQLVDYTKAIFEITRSYHRLLTDEEFQHENNLWVQWEVLQVMMQNVSEFISIQSPIMERQLEEMFKNLESQASDYCEEATSGKFLDPNQNPSKIVEQIRQIRHNFHDIQQKLVTYSKWRKDICEEPFDLSFLNTIVFKMDARNDLWKYLLNTIQSIDTWMLMPFRKMKFSNAMKKINEWKTAAANLKLVLPPGDFVLEFWNQYLDNFLEPLPLLQIISSDRHKSRHWDSIFNGMSAIYKSNKEYLVQELLSLDLTKQRGMIMAVHQLAIAEYDLEQRVKKMIKVWGDKMFKLLKYFPDSHKDQKELKSSSEYRVESEEYYSQNIISQDDEYYILIDTEQLTAELMDDSIILATMLSSSYLGDMKGQVENLSSALYQVEKIIDLWVSSQRKWMFLVKIFEKSYMVDKFPQFAKRFEVSVHCKFKEWMRVVYVDSKILSVATKSITEKGYRFLQGEQLRKMFLNVIESMDNIIENLRFFLDENRIMFPRLFFLSDNELVEVLSISDDPHELPGVRRCFPGIDSITLIVLGTNLMSSKLAATELAINAHRLITIGIEGRIGEQFLLIRTVGPMMGVIQWLCDLESSMKDTMVDQLARCVEEKLKSACIIHPTNDGKTETMTFKQWITEFPIECLRLAEAITWEGQMEKFLTTANRNAMHKLKSDIEKQIRNLSHQPKTSSVSTSINLYDRKYYVHTTLIALWINLRDLTQVLLEDESVGIQSFEWQTALKYHVTHKTVLRAENEQQLIPNLDPESSGEPNLTRIKTTMKTMHKVTRCVIHHLSVKIPYGYEYLGPSSVFLNTPLTEKAMLSLTHSLKNYQCGSIVGPSSVGKTETIKEFSRAFGQCLFHIKCGELVSSFRIKQCITGMVTSGCWALFDDVNRLTKDVMCTISEYFDQIQTALRGLQSEKNSQYGLRGQAKVDKPSSPYDGTLKRRNSLTTLHTLESIPTSEDIMAPLNTRTSPQYEVNSNGLITFLADEWVTEKNLKRSSIYEVANIREFEIGPESESQATLSYEQVRLLNMRTEKDFCLRENKTLYKRAYTGNLKFDGRFLRACSNYGCFMTLNTTEAKYQDIPDNFRLLLRPFSLLTPDYQQIAQVYCLMYGFIQHEILAKKLVAFINLFQTWLPRKVQFQVKNLSFVMSVLTALKRTKAENYKFDESNETEKNQEEKQFMIKAIKEVFLPYLDEGRDKVQFCNLLKDVFGYVPKDDTTEDPFHQALQDHLKENHLQLNSVMISKMVELYKNCSQSSRSTIICGPSGSGKTLILKTLIQTLNMLSYKAAAIEKPNEEILQRRESEVIISKANQKIKSRMQLLQHIISSIRPAPSSLNKAILKKKKDSSHYPQIYMSHLFPGGIPPEEFLGYNGPNGWQSGILWRELRKTTFSDALTSQDQSKQEHVADTHVWLIFDGSVHPSWCDPISNLFDSSRTLMFPNADTFMLNDETKLIIETDQLNDASPTMLNQCSVVFCSPTNFQWESVFNTWKEKVRHKCYMSYQGIKLLEDLANAMIPATLKLFHEENDITHALVADLSPLDYRPIVIGLQEVTAFLNLLSILLDTALLQKNSSESKSDNCKTDGCDSCEQFSLPHYRPDEEIPNYIDIIKGTFVFAFIWGFGAHLHERNKDQYSEHVRECLSKMAIPIHLPAEGTVFDYWVDKSDGGFYTWKQKLKETSSYKCRSNYVFIYEFERYDYLVKLLLDHKIPILISGDPGVGKTSFIKNLLLDTKTKRHCMSRLQTPNRLMEIILFQEKGSGVWTGRSGSVSTSAAERGKALNSKKIKKATQSPIIFIDDLNMAPKENDCQPTLELFRQVLSLGTVFDKQQHSESNVKHLNFLAATTLPSAPGAGLGNSCHVMSSRLSRLFFNITFHTPTYDQLDTIYSSSTFTWLNELPPPFVRHPCELATAITQVTLELYRQIKDRLHASPARPLYVFTLYDIAHLFDGIRLFSSLSATQKLLEHRKSVDLDSSSSLGNNLNETSPVNSSNNSPDLPLTGLVIRLWVHECNRTFADRIIDKEDYDWYLQTMEQLVDKFFCQPSLEPALDMTVITETEEEAQSIRSSISDGSFISGSGSTASERSAMVPGDLSEESVGHERRATESGSCTGIQDDPEVITESFRDEDIDQTLSESSIKAKRENQSREAANGQSEERGKSCPSKNWSVKRMHKETRLETRTSKMFLLRFEEVDQNDTHTCESVKPAVSCIFFFRFLIEAQKQEVRRTMSGTEVYSYSKRPSVKKVFFGALLLMEEIKGDLKSFDDIIFSRYILYSDSSERGYTECLLNQVIDALKKRIIQYNGSLQLKWNMTLIDAFIPIIIKLTRILTFPQGHGLFFRTNNRSSSQTALTKLAAYLAKVEVIQPSADNSVGQSYDLILEESLKMASHQAGVLAIPTVLLVPELFAYNCDLTSISTLLAQGDCPNLYEEGIKLSNLVHTALSEKRPTITINKLTDEQLSKVFQIFFSRVKQNLHVIIFLTLEDFGLSGHKTHDLLEHYPALIKHSCSVSVQDPLSTNAYQQLTLSWIKEENIQNMLLDPIVWGLPAFNERIILGTVSAALAYTHQTAQIALMRQVINQRQIFTYYTINHLRELVHMFKQIVMLIIQKEKVKVSHYAGALGKVNEAFGSINDYKETICRLSPQHKTAVDNIQDCVTNLSKKRAAFKKLLGLNKEQEEKISKLKKLQDKMNDSYKRMFLQVEPQYREALKNLKSIDRLAWSEVKKYRQPPEPIKKLLGAVCLLFGRPITWKEGVSLMSNANFLNNIIYYNKRDLSEEMYFALQKYIVSSDLQLKSMSLYSRAAASICQWVFSIYQYATIIRKNQPFMIKLHELHKKLIKAHEVLGKLRKETVFWKDALDKHVKMCKESMKNAKSLEKQIKNIEKKVADASNLMGNISGQHKLWKKEVNIAKQNISTAIGDGLLAAAYVCYCGPLDDQTRKKLLDEWLVHFEQEMFTDVTASKLYPRLYRKSPKCKCSHPHRDSQDSDDWVTVQAYEATVHQTEFNYSSGLMTAANTESFDDIMDYDSDNEDETRKVIMVRKNFQLLKVLSSYDELSEWRMQNYPVDSRSLQNACIINMCKWNSRTLWPLLVDPDGQAELWVRNVHVLSLEKERNSEAESLIHSSEYSPIETADFLQHDFGQNTLSPGAFTGLQAPCNDWTIIDKICILPADDPLLDSKIWDAINYGFLLLVTHVGHQPLNETLHWLVSCNKIQTTEYDNTLTVLKSPKLTSPCHKDFFLFLSTNVPLNIHGYNFHYLPLEEMNIIDMSLSNEAVMNRILYETLHVERLDFEKQRRANETDIIQQRQQLYHQFALIREKTMNLEGPLIEDKTILESLLACQRNVERNRLILDESCSKERHLEETYAPYVPMAIEAATIYSSLKDINQIYPCYYVSFNTFIKLFMNGLQSRNRNYGEAGEPKSRASELLNAATTSIFKFVSIMMFEEHLTVFYLGFALERFLQNKMATEVEIGIFVNGFKIKENKIDSILIEKASWISEKVWAECFLLEDMLDAFKGLKKSLLLLSMSKQWKEYFKSPIILMNRVPEKKLKDLTIFQKSLLWKIFCPHKFGELCQSLIVSELGSLIIPPDNYNIKEVYKLTQSNTPVLFMLPSPLKENQQTDGTQEESNTAVSKPITSTSFDAVDLDILQQKANVIRFSSVASIPGSLYSDPVRELKRFAKELKMDGKVYVINCTSELTPDGLKDIIDECFDNSYWLVLQNYHMCDSNIHLQLASILKMILWEEPEIQPSSEISSKEQLTNFSPDLEEQVPEVNNFRLWVTFASQQTNERLPPACLIQKSVKVTCETSRNFQSTLLKSHRAAKFLLNNYNKSQKKNQPLVSESNQNFEIMALAALHSILIQHRCFAFLQHQRIVFEQPCHWSMLDMASVSDFFCNWLPINTPQTLTKLVNLMSGIYSSHCTDEYDAALVKAVTLDTLNTMYLEKKRCQPDSVFPYCNTLKGDVDHCSKRSQLAPDLLSLLFCSTDAAKTSRADTANQMPSIKGLGYSLHKKVDSTIRANLFSNVCDQVYGLPIMAQHTLLQQQSRILCNKITILGGYQSLLKQPSVKIADIFRPQLTNIVEQITEQLNSLPEFPDISKMFALDPDEHFLHYEIQNYTKLFHLIIKQMEILKKHLTQQNGLTKEMLEIKKLISENEIPTVWLSFSFPSNLKLTDWLKNTVANTKQLFSLVGHFSVFQTHDLAIFLRPDCLFSVIIQMYARENGKELTDLSIEGMFQNKTDDPPPSTSNIILTNASLCNAKWKMGSIHLTKSNTRMNSQDKESTYSKGLLYLKITDKSMKQTNQPFYLCPVFLSEEDLNLSKRNSVMEINLPVTGDNLLFYGKRVHLHFTQDD